MNKMRVFTFFLFLVGANAVFGCTCGSTSISEMYENADVVVVATALSYKPATVFEDWIRVDGEKETLVQDKLEGQEVRLLIARQFKGTNLQKTLKLSQPGSTCDWEFRDGDLNKPLLLYLRFNKKYKTYKIISCGRSGTAKSSADELSWLNGLPGSLNRTRLSGVVRFNDDQNLFPGVGGVKITISGNGKTYSLISDKNGMYEIWDAPAGKYKITAEMPVDKKIDWITSVPDGFVDYELDENPNPESSIVALAPKSTAGVDFMLENK